MKKLFKGAMLGDRSSRWSVIAVVTAFLAHEIGSDKMPLFLTSGRRVQTSPDVENASIKLSNA